MNSEKYKTHKDLDVWRISIEFVTEIYRLTDKFPRGEESGLKSQIRRAVVSIPANISDGAARNSTKEFIRFLYFSLGSLSELETLLIISENLGFINPSTSMATIVILRKMIFGLIGSLKK